MAWLETISLTASPAPYRLACRRTNQLPMPASGASTTRFGIVIPPSSQGSCRLRIRERIFRLPGEQLVPRARLGRRTPALRFLIALPDQPQALEREQRVDVVDVL